MRAVLDWQLDVIGFVIATAIAWLIAVVLVRRRGGRMNLGLLPVLIALAAVVLGSLWANQAQHALTNRLQAMLEGFGPTYALELSRHEHAKITLDTPPDDPTYLDLIDMQKSWLSANPGIADVYTFRRRGDGKIVLLVDSETDYDRNGAFEGERESRTVIGEEYDENAVEIARALAGESVFISEPSTDRWGTWVSQFVPLRAPDGTIEAVCGVDYPAEAWVSQLVRARALPLATSSVVALIAIGAGMFVAFARLERDRQRVIAEELRTAKLAAESASEAKTNFLANMSHEVRTPLTGVMGMLELLIDSKIPETERRHAKIAFSSAQSLLAILNDVLDTSKIESGEILLEDYPIEVRTSFEEWTARFEPKASAKGIELSCMVAADVPERVRGDAVRIAQVISNLVANGVKFTARGEVAVTVRTRHEGGADWLRVEVRDTGEGIPVEARDRIFKRFSQVDESITRRHGGTGLGLSICDGLVKRMGGRIGFESAVGVGSLFWFELPLRAEPSEAGAAPVVAQEAPLVPLSSAPVVAVSSGPTQPAGLRVLVVEDNEVVQDVLGTIIEGAGHSCVIERSGRGAIERVEREAFDLIFMDCHMPGMDGFEATRRIRALESAGRLPSVAGRERVMICAVTAATLAGDEERCRAAGMDAYLAKPVNAETLHRVIAEVDGRSRGKRAA